MGEQQFKNISNVVPRDPVRPTRLTQLAAAYYFERDYENAVKTALQVIRQYPNNPMAYRWLSASLGELINRYDEAQVVLRDLQALAPSSLDMWVRQRQSSLREKEYEHMLEGLRKAGWQE